MALLLPGLRALRKLSGGVADRATAAALRSLEDGLDELIRRLSKVEGGGGISLPITMADVTGLVAALAGKVTTGRNINTTSPLTGGGDLSADRTLAVNTFGAAQDGVVPLSGGGTTNFLRADVSWAEPPGLVSKEVLFGSGNDGDLVFDGAATILGLVPAANIYTMNRDIWADDLTIDSGVTVRPNGFRIYVLGTLTLNGTIEENGGNGGNGGTGAGASGTAGSSRAATYGCARAAGGTGGNQGAGGLAGANTTNVWRYGVNGSVAGGPAAGAGATGNSGTNGGVFQGAGGASGGGHSAGTSPAGSNGGSVTMAAVALGPWVDEWLAASTCRPSDYTSAQLSCGSGGGGGSGGGLGGAGSAGCGGGGGGGGGWVFVAAYNVTGSGSIEAKGGNGGNGGNASGGNNGGGGGGGGGAGGVVILVTKAGGTTPTISVAGGAGGTGGTKSGTGGNGGTGGTGGAGVSRVFN